MKDNSKVKVKVLEKFIDKHTGKVHKVGDILNIKKERLVEIKEVEETLKKKLIEEVVAESETTNETTTEKTTKKATKKDTE